MHMLISVCLVGMLLRPSQTSSDADYSIYSNSVSGPDHSLSNNVGFSLETLSPFERIKAKRSAAQRMKVPGLSSVTEDQDLSIFDGFTFPNSRVSMPSLLSGAYYGFSLDTEDRKKAPFENSFYHVVFDELLDISYSDPEVF